MPSCFFIFGLLLIIASGTVNAVDEASEMLVFGIIFLIVSIALTCNASLSGAYCG